MRTKTASEQGAVGAGEAPRRGEDHETGAGSAVVGGEQLLFERLHRGRLGVLLVVHAEQVQDAVHEQAGRARRRRCPRARAPGARRPPGR